jgi:hypothetical protein
MTVQPVHCSFQQSISARSPVRIGVTTMSDKFETAYRRARQKIGEERWPLLSDEEQEWAVAEELRILENENPEGPDA